MRKGPIIDSDISLEQALAQNPAGPQYPQAILDQQRLLTVRYYSFDRKLHQGQIVVNEAVVGDTEELFRLITELIFPVAKVVPIAAPGYEWDEQKLVVEENVTSGFEYRFIKDTNRLSLHAKGLAIDINPQQNPYIRYQDGKEIIWPPEAKWDPSKPGTLSKNHEIVQFMEGWGWEWGGDWGPDTGRTDYMHFQKCT